jgi:tetratricopeptide (TPR) repeat protein
MNTRTFSLVVLSTLAVAGCQTTKPVSYFGKLEHARQAIVAGRTTVAAQRIENARVLEEQQSGQTFEADLLLIELMLHENNATDAVSKAQEVIESKLDNPRANEVLGKALLQAGRLSDAESVFAAASEAYDEPGDQGRVDDLLALTRGLSAFANGDPQVARQYWATIRNDELRFTLDKTVRSEAVATRTP